MGGGGGGGPIECFKSANTDSIDGWVSLAVFWIPKKKFGWTVFYFNDCHLDTYEYFW